MINDEKQNGRRTLYFLRFDRPSVRIQPAEGGADIFLLIRPGYKNIYPHVEALSELLEQPQPDHQES